MSNNLEHLLSVNCKLGEGPVWSQAEQKLYWVDIEQACFHTFEPATKQHQVFQVGLAVGSLALRRAGGLVLATKGGFAFSSGRDTDLEFVADPEEGNPLMRFNDGKVDRQGRFWAGSVHQQPAIGLAEGSLYRLNPDLSVARMEISVGITNGIDWSLDNTLMYYTDSLRKVIYAYDFEPASGTIANRRIFIDSTAEEGVPDGLTVDSEGYIWSVRWGGWKITRYDPAGKVEREIEMPVEYPTSCMFGGENLDELFITSAWTAFGPTYPTGQPLAGDLFRFKTEIKGLEQASFAG